MLNCPFCEAPWPSNRIPAKGVRVALCEECFNPAVITVSGTDPTIARIAGQPDIRGTATPNSMAGDLFSAMRTRLDELPVLPGIAAEVLRMVRDPEVSMRDLGQAVGEDPVIAAKVLRVANSAMYGGMSEIGDLGAACARLGMQTVSNVVQAAAGGYLYKTRHEPFRIMMTRLQRHAVATAHCAHEIAKTIADPHADLLFTAGLLHRIGAVLLIDAATEAQGGPLTRLRENPALLDELLTAYYPIAGLLLVQRWNLPAELASTVFCHAHPGAAPDNDLATMAHVVALASDIADASGFPLHDEPGDGMLMAHPGTSFLGLTDVKLAAIRVDLEDRVAPYLEIAA